MVIVLIKLSVSALLGLLIGIERELKHKPLGLKTCIVIAVSSCLLTIVSIESAETFAELSPNIRTDPMRLAAQIVSGIGFIGAGVILRRNNDAISGLTTAAIIWGASGLGIAAGASFYYEAFVGAGLILFSVNILPWIIKRIGPKALRQREMRAKLTLKKNVNVSHFMKAIVANDFEIRHVRVRDTKEKNPQIELKLMTFEKNHTTDIYEQLRKVDGVNEVEVEG
ncbi:MgtC/SapB family protein [Pseudalkalibacillus hwajinpoensis]|uniref:MgtC/SapB family protein n=1 Tax=Guptibacillus hwajinpoensis TaxID=208199 RepID=UPI001CD1D9B5|nr:MgtC/SapB family protein [Pseudalkalibacillus hwajinpoensis]MCA0991473.1 MgtC/SapB family protein [Pseudalkalibacillus hwajinpoensis]